MKKDKYKTTDFGFKEPAIYKIVVLGGMDSQYVNQLWGLQATVLKKKGEKSITTLIGQINDQSALSGILTMINDRQLIVVSVNMLSELESA